MRRRRVLCGSVVSLARACSSRWRAAGRYGCWRAPRRSGLWRKEADGTYADGGRYSPKSLSAAGAHDLAPNPKRGGFGTAWQKLGLKHPETELAADLSNIDDFVKDVFHELRAKGLNLK